MKVDSAVGDMLECDIVCRCSVAAGCEKVGDVEGCNWMTVLVFGHVYWSNKRRTTAVGVSVRTLTSGGVSNVLPFRADGSVHEVCVFLFCNCSPHWSPGVFWLNRDSDVFHT